MAARAARFHALANPNLFLGQQLVCLGGNRALLRKLFLLLHHVLGKIARVGQQLSPIEFHNARRHPVQKRAVVRDGHHAAAEVNQQVFQPFNGVKVQVVGWLVQQQHIGPRHQCLCQRHALLGTARQVAHERIRLQMQAMQRFFHTLLPIPGVIGLDFSLQSVQVQSFFA